MMELSPLMHSYVEDNPVSAGHQSTTDRLEFYYCSPAKGWDAFGEAANHHFAKPGKMLRAKMALRASNLLNVDSACSSSGGCYRSAA